jgi:2'-5' RNA ligase
MVITKSTPPLQPPSGKVVTSALAIIPPENSATWVAIQALRQEHDRQIDRWPPHINLLYPFVPSEHFDACAETIASILVNTPTFKLTFDKISYFKHGKSCTAWLAPDPAARERLKELQTALEAAFPHCDDLARRQPGEVTSAFSPHLTVGQFRNEAQVQAFIQKTPFVPLTIEVSQLQLLSRSNTRPFVALKTVSLARGLVVHSSAPPTDVGHGVTQVPPQQNNFYQTDNELLRVCFEIPGDRCKGLACKGASQMLFVVDNSSSMHGHYSSVTQAVKYMVEETKQGGGNGNQQSPAFVLYNSTAKLCSGDEVMRR